LLLEEAIDRGLVHGGDSTPATVTSNRPLYNDGLDAYAARQSGDFRYDFGVAFTEEQQYETQDKEARG
jgi:hypothetical protein